MPRPFGYKVSQETKDKISKRRKALGLRPMPYKRNEKITLLCLHCENKFEVVASRESTAMYCSKRCYSESQKVKGPYNKGLFKSTSYSQCHYRVRKLRGTPKKCEVCGSITAKKYEWANLSGNYEDINDYKRMCTSCHCKHDGKIKNIKHFAGFSRLTERKFTIKSKVHGKKISYENLSLNNCSMGIVTKEDLSEITYEDLMNDKVIF